MKSFLLRYKFKMGLGMLVLCIIGGMWFNFRLILARKDRTIEQAKVEIFNHLKSDSLAKITEANRKAELDGLFLMQKKETIKYKNLYFEILDARQDTVKETGQIKVTFDKTKNCARVWGHTLTATEALPTYSKVEVEIFPIGIERNYIEVGGKIMEIITPKNDCIEFEDNRFDASPGLYRTHKEGRSWFGYGVGFGGKIFEEETNAWGFNDFEIMSGLRFWSMYAILTSDFETTRFGLMYWK